jgi:ferredoxin-NADP reductase|tara:strand:+ start:3519 stop:4220 length:702 start_codon:yes stop_codon:yes gene_type:complete
MSAKIFESKVIESEYSHPKVKCLKFSTPKSFKFKAGQYLSLTIISNGKKFRRPYSISSSPNSEHVGFCVKLNKGSESSSFVKKLKKGDNVELFGPLGKFVVDSKSKKKESIFISTGTGISPFRSMIPWLLEEGCKKKIILLKGFRNEKEILYNNEFLKLQRKYKNFEFHNILSKPKNKKFKDKGHVQDFFDKYVPKDFDGNFYLCGLRKMVMDVEKKLEKIGIKKNRIFFEEY